MRRLVVGLLAGALAIAAPAGGAPEARAEEGVHPREQTRLKREWGVEIVHVRASAAGYMLELRYRVLDAEAAAPLFRRDTKPVLTHVESGARLIVPTPPTTGALRNSNPPVAGRTYWMLFANPGGLVKPGEHVDIDIGAFHAAQLVVR